MPPMEPTGGSPGATRVGPAHGGGGDGPTVRVKTLARCSGIARGSPLRAFPSLSANMPRDDPILGKSPGWQGSLRRPIFEAGRKREGEACQW